MIWTAVAALGLCLGAEAWEGIRRNQVHDRLTRAREDMRSLTGGIMSLGIDYCGGGRPATAHIEDDSPTTPEWTFRVEPYSGPNPYPHWPSEQPSLTTPVAYLAEYPRDPFTGEMYGYWTRLNDPRPPDGGSPISGFILTCAGPDAVCDLNPRETWLACHSACEEAREAERQGPGRHEAEIPLSVLNLLYDPTNGMRSVGDLALFAAHYDVVNLATEGRLSLAGF
jgi:hypothetical protein